MLPWSRPDGAGGTGLSNSARRAARRGAVARQEKDAEQMYQRCDLLQADYDPTDVMKAMELARGPRFQLGVLYRRDPGQAPGLGEMDGQATGGVWPPVTQPLSQDAPSDNEFPGG